MERKQLRQQQEARRLAAAAAKGAKGDEGETSSFSVGEEALLSAATRVKVSSTSRDALRAPNSSTARPALLKRMFSTG
jgi:hypothetical protein